MGFHVCEYCPPYPKGNRFSHMSSGDVTLVFHQSGRSWTMPDMILHYVADHGWRPPQAFIDDVMNDELAASGRVQYRGARLGGTPIGYLTGDRLHRERGSVPGGLVAKLEVLMKRADAMGYRAQTKGLSPSR